MKEYQNKQKRQQGHIVYLAAKKYEDEERKSTTDESSKGTQEPPYLPLCKFSCTLCQSKFNRWHSMRLHLTKRHDKRGKRCNPLDFVWHSEYYTCEECKKQILHDPSLISDHIKVRLEIKVF